MTDNLVSFDLLLRVLWARVLAPSMVHSAMVGNTQSANNDMDAI
ncbi:hypothetical protein [Eggerthella guodeyinii]|nr:hypothetical protein [Eggerthella guodeyinii]